MNGQKIWGLGTHPPSDEPGLSNLASDALCVIWALNIYDSSKGISVGALTGLLEKACIVTLARGEMLGT